MKKLCLPTSWSLWSSPETMRLYICEAGDEMGCFRGSGTAGAQGGPSLSHFRLRLKDEKVLG